MHGSCHQLSNVSNIFVLAKLWEDILGTLLSGSSTFIAHKCPALGRTEQWAKKKEWGKLFWPRKEGNLQMEASRSATKMGNLSINSLESPVNAKGLKEGTDLWLQRQEEESPQSTSFSCLAFILCWPPQEKALMGKDILVWQEKKCRSKPLPAYLSF